VDPALPEGDPEQLFAEASVYLRYGKRDQAITSLEAVLEQEPEHRPALEKLGEGYAEVDRNSDAVSVWSRAAVLARSDGDESGFEVLRDRIAALDPDAAEQLGDAASGDSAAFEFEDEDSAAEQDVAISLEPSAAVADEDVELELTIAIDDGDAAGAGTGAEE
jgi:tetratricopeptide (TPR) repeat protein